MTLFLISWEPLILIDHQTTHEQGHTTFVNPFAVSKGKFCKTKDAGYRRDQAIYLSQEQISHLYQIKI